MRITALCLVLLCTIMFIVDASNVAREKGADTTTSTTMTPDGKGVGPKGKRPKEKGFSGKAPQEKNIDEVYGKLPVPGRNGPPEKTTPFS